MPESVDFKEAKNVDLFNNSMNAVVSSLEVLALDEVSEKDVNGSLASLKTALTNTPTTESFAVLRNALETAITTCNAAVAILKAADENISH